MQDGESKTAKCFPKVLLRCRSVCLIGCQALTRVLATAKSINLQKLILELSCQYTTHRIHKDKVSLRKMSFGKLYGYLVRLSTRNKIVCAERRPSLQSRNKLTEQFLLGQCSLNCASRYRQSKQPRH